MGIMRAQVHRGHMVSLSEDKVDAFVTMGSKDNAVVRIVPITETIGIDWTIMVSMECEYTGGLLYF